MDTFLAILSFPFWCFGAVFVSVGIWGKVTAHGMPYYGTYYWPIKIGVTVVGFIFFAIAYALV